MDKDAWRGKYAWRGKAPAQSDPANPGGRALRHRRARPWHQEGQSGPGGQRFRPDPACRDNPSGPEARAGHLDQVCPALLSPPQALWAQACPSCLPHPAARADRSCLGTRWVQVLPSRPAAQREAPPCLSAGILVAAAHICQRPAGEERQKALAHWGSKHVQGCNAKHRHWAQRATFPAKDNSKR